MSKKKGSKQNTKQEPNRDHLSNLPDEILRHIISLLPFQLAVKTSLLSTRWKNLWKNPLEEDAHTIEDAIVALSRFVDDFDEIHQLRKNWGLKINYGDCGVLLAAVAPSATLHGKALHLDFSGILEPVSSLDGGSWYSKILSVKVKSLHLMSVPAYLTGKNKMSFILSEFWFLESLSISNCNQLEIVAIGNLKKSLKSLTILDCPRLKRLNIQGSDSLSTLRFRGTLPLEFGLQRDFWNLNDAMFDFRPEPAGVQHDKFISVCHILSHHLGTVESLTLRGCLFEMVLPQLRDRKAYVFRKLKSLWWIDSYNSKEKRYNSNALMWFLNRCPILEKLYVTVDPKSCSMTSTCQYSESKRLGEHKLKVVKLEGFAKEKEVMALAWRLMKEFSVERVIVKSHWSDCLQFLDKVRNKKQKEKGKFSYKLKGGVKNVHEVCPDHVHMNL